MESELVRSIYANRGRALELLSDYAAAAENYAALECEADRRDDDKLRLGALIGKAIIHSTFTPLFDPDLGLPLAEKALQLADRLDEHDAEAEVLWTLMLVHAYVLVNPRQAIEYGKQALELARTRKLDARLPYILNDLGRITGFIGQIEEGMPLMVEARPLFEAQNNLPLIADNSNGYSLLLMFVGKLDEGLSFGTDAIEVSRSLNNDKGIRDSFGRVNSILLEKGEVGRAISAIEEQIALFGDIDNVVVFGLPILALAYTTIGDTGLILERYAAERHRAGSLGHLFHDFFLAPLAHLYLLNGQLEQAAGVLAEIAFDPYSDPFLPINVWVILAEARLLFARGQCDQALSLLDSAISAEVENGLNYFLGDLMLLQAQVLLAMDPAQPDRARSVLRQAKLALEEADAYRILWRILAALADLADPEEALALCKEAQQIIQRIAGGIEEPNLKEAFLANPSVANVMKAAT